MTTATLDTAFEILNRGPSRLTQAERDQLRDLQHRIDTALTIDRQLATPPMPSPAHRPPNDWESRF